MKKNLSVNMSAHGPPRNARLVYLITYSRVDVDITPTRQSFANLVVDAFNSLPCNILQWVVGKEAHSDGEGFHYHMAVKLDSRRRWLRVRNWLDATYGINVNFSGVHANYYSAWCYATKEDNHYLQSTGPPDLSNAAPPTTTNASQTVLGDATQISSASTSGQRKRKRHRLSN